MPAPFGPRKPVHDQAVALDGPPGADPARRQRSYNASTCSEASGRTSPSCGVPLYFTGVELTSEVSKGEYAERILRGGFPESLRRAQPRRRQRFFDSYLDDLIRRDLQQLAEIERPAQMGVLTRLLAARNAHLLVRGPVARELGVAQPTVTRYLSLLEEVFLIKRVPAWSRNLGARAVGTSKVGFVDSGIAGNLLGLDEDALLRPDGPFGPLLEGFVLMELARQLTWSDTRADLWHYRTKDKVEVDAVLENRRGQVIGIEVKASSTPRAEDFQGLRHLEARVGSDLLAGFLLYTGRTTIPFGPKFRALPVSGLWRLAP